ncbi:MAG: hypothetical protein JW839_15675, partial [Candidatus Lokiarchaeota archaeon]|nr:hypothetical protein [Candidatus Lokiarchaeota archaeon]
RSAVVAYENTGTAAGPVWRARLVDDWDELLAFASIDAGIYLAANINPSIIVADEDGVASKTLAGTLNHELIADMVASGDPLVHLVDGTYQDYFVESLGVAPGQPGVVDYAGYEQYTTATATAGPETTLAISAPAATTQAPSMLSSATVSVGPNVNPVSRLGYGQVGISAGTTFTLYRNMFPGSGSVPFASTTPADPSLPSSYTQGIKDVTLDDEVLYDGDTTTGTGAMNASSTVALLPVYCGSTTIASKGSISGFNVAQGTVGFDDSPLPGTITVGGGNVVDGGGSDPSGKPDYGGTTGQPQGVVSITSTSLGTGADIIGAIDLGLKDRIDASDLPANGSGINVTLSIRAFAIFKVKYSALWPYPYLTCVGNSWFVLPLSIAPSGLPSRTVMPSMFAGSRNWTRDWVIWFSTGSGNVGPVGTTLSAPGPDFLDLSLHSVTSWTMNWSEFLNLQSSDTVDFSVDTLYSGMADAGSAPGDSLWKTWSIRGVNDDGQYEWIDYRLADLTDPKCVVERVSIIIDDAWLTIDSTGRDDFQTLDEWNTKSSSTLEFPINTREIVLDLKNNSIYPSTLDARDIMDYTKTVDIQARMGLSTSFNLGAQGAARETYRSVYMPDRGNITILGTNCGKVNYETHSLVSVGWPAACAPFYKNAYGRTNDQYQDYWHTGWQAIGPYNATITSGKVALEIFNHTSSRWLDLNQEWNGEFISCKESLYAEYYQLPHVPDFTGTNRIVISCSINVGLMNEDQKDAFFYHLIGATASNLTIRFKCVSSVLIKHDSEAIIYHDKYSGAPGAPDYIETFIATEGPQLNYHSFFRINQILKINELMTYETVPIDMRGSYNLTTSEHQAVCNFTNPYNPSLHMGVYKASISANVAPLVQQFAYTNPSASWNNASWYTGILNRSVPAIASCTHANGTLLPGFYFARAKDYQGRWTDSWTINSTATQRSVAMPVWILRPEMFGMAYKVRAEIYNHSSADPATRWVLAPYGNDGTGQYTGMVKETSKLPFYSVADSGRITFGGLPSIVGGAMHGYDQVPFNLNITKYGLLSGNITKDLVVRLTVILYWVDPIVTSSPWDAYDAFTSFDALKRVNVTIDSPSVIWTMATPPTTATAAPGAASGAVEYDLPPSLQDLALAGQASTAVDRPYWDFSDDIGDRSDWVWGNDIRFDTSVHAAAGTGIFNGSVSTCSGATLYPATVSTGGWIRSMVRGIDPVYVDSLQKRGGALGGAGGVLESFDRFPNGATILSAPAGIWENGGWHTSHQSGVMRAYDHGGNRWGYIELVGSSLWAHCNYHFPTSWTPAIPVPYAGAQRVSLKLMTSSAAEASVLGISTIDEHGSYHSELMTFWEGMACAADYPNQQTVQLFPASTWTPYEVEFVIFSDNTPYLAYDIVVNGMTFSNGGRHYHAQPLEGRPIKAMTFSDDFLVDDIDASWCAPVYFQQASRSLVAEIYTPTAGARIGGTVYYSVQDFVSEEWSDGQVAFPVTILGAGLSYINITAARYPVAIAGTIATLAQYQAGNGTAIFPPITSSKDILIRGIELRNLGAQQQAPPITVQKVYRSWGPINELARNAGLHVTEKETTITPVLSFENINLSNITSGTLELVVHDEITGRDVVLDNASVPSITGVSVISGKVRMTIAMLKARYSSDAAIDGTPITITIPASQLQLGMGSWEDATCLGNKLARRFSVEVSVVAGDPLKWAGTANMSAALRTRFATALDVPPSARAASATIEYRLGSSYASPNHAIIEQPVEMSLAMPASAINSTEALVFGIESRFDTAWWMLPAPYIEPGRANITNHVAQAAPYTSIAISHDPNDVTLQTFLPGRVTFDRLDVWVLNSNPGTGDPAGIVAEIYRIGSDVHDRASWRLVASSRGNMARYPSTTAPARFSFAFSMGAISDMIAADIEAGDVPYGFVIRPEGADIALLANTNGFGSGCAHQYDDATSSWWDGGSPGMDIDFVLEMDGRVSLRGDNEYASLYEFLASNAGGEASIFQVYDYTTDQWLNTWTVPKISVLDDPMWDYFGVSRGDRVVTFQFIYYPDLTALKVPVSHLMQNGTIRGRLHMDFGSEFTDPATCTMSYFETRVANVTAWTRRSAVAQETFTYERPFDVTISTSTQIGSVEELDALAFAYTGGDTFTVYDNQGNALAPAFSLIPGTSWTMPAGGKVRVTHAGRWVELFDATTGEFVSLEALDSMADFKAGIERLAEISGNGSIRLRGKIVSAVSVSNFRPSPVNISCVHANMSVDVYHSAWESNLVSDRDGVQRVQVAEVDGIGGLPDVVLDSGLYARNEQGEGVFRVKFVVHDHDPLSNETGYSGPDLTGGNITSYEGMMDEVIRDIVIDQGTPRPAFLVDPAFTNANGTMERRGTIPLLVQVRQLHVANVTFWYSTDNDSWDFIGIDDTIDGDVFEATWDTIGSNISDGEYAIMAVGTDTHGRAGNCTAQLIVDNTDPLLVAYLNPVFYDVGTGEISRKGFVDVRVEDVSTLSDLHVTIWDMNHTAVIVSHDIPDPGTIEPWNAGIAGVIMSEIQFDAGMAPYIELYNTRDTIADVGGWVFTFSNGLANFTIPEGKTVLPHSCMTLSVPSLSAFSCTIDGRTNLSANISVSLVAGNTTVDHFRANGYHGIVPQEVHWTGQSISLYYEYDANGALLMSSMLDAQRTRTGWIVMPGLGVMAWQNVTHPMFCDAIPVELENIWREHGIPSMIVEMYASDLAGNSIDWNATLHLNETVATCLLPDTYLVDFIGAAVDQSTELPQFRGAWLTGAVFEFDMFVAAGTSWISSSVMFSSDGGGSAGMTLISSSGSSLLLCESIPFATNQWHHIIMELGINGTGRFSVDGAWTGMRSLLPAILFGKPTDYSHVSFGWSFYRADYGRTLLFDDISSTHPANSTWSHDFNGFYPGQVTIGMRVEIDPVATSDPYIFGGSVSCVVVDRFGMAISGTDVFMSVDGKAFKSSTTDQTGHSSFKLDSMDAFSANIFDPASAVTPIGTTDEVDLDGFAFHDNAAGVVRVIAGSTLWLKHFSIDSETNRELVSMLDVSTSMDMAAGSTSWEGIQVELLIPGVYNEYYRACTYESITLEFIEADGESFPVVLGREELYKAISAQPDSQDIAINGEVYRRVKISLPLSRVGLSSPYAQDFDIATVETIKITGKDYKLFVGDIESYLNRGVLPLQALGILGITLVDWICGATWANRNMTGTTRWLNVTITAGNA